MNELASVDPRGVRDAFDVATDGLAEEFAELPDGEGDAVAVLAVGV